MESREILTMRQILKEEAKGKLNAMLHTFWDDDEYYDIASKTEEYIKEVLDELMG